MEPYRKCKHCDVEVSSDLTNCPLCGKYLLGVNEKPQTNKYSYPIYKMTEIYRNKWVGTVRAMFFVVSIICLIINLIWRTKPFFFPYVWAALIMIMVVFVAPFSKKRSYVRNLTWSSIILSLFLIFIDVYDYYTIGTKFGWALGYAAPFVLAGMTLAAAIICLASKRLEVDMIKSVMILFVYSIIYFCVVIFAFSGMVRWPSLVFMAVSFAWFLLLQVIKRNILWKQLEKDLHL